jgi:hypothetical protein
MPKRATYPDEPEADSPKFCLVREMTPPGEPDCVFRKGEIGVILAERKEPNPKTRVHFFRHELNQRVVFWTDLVAT